MLPASQISYFEMYSAHTALLRATWIWVMKFAQGINELDLWSHLLLILL